ncbi:translation initiation factor IF-2-like [Prionailurus bengalensis]|uniref:translation initiation factor IF-2-like n=1 Tax=Prionailurus bengalensis TaxID=37029 RepID=UPI001CA8AA9D|nr:translation initiation factor IF-2-like [Prionailurus bengalensis]
MIMKKKEHVSLSPNPKEAREAWGAAGAEDPSLSTFDVSLTSIYNLTDDVGYQGSQELTSTRSPVCNGTGQWRARFIPCSRIPQGGRPRPPSVQEAEAQQGRHRPAEEGQGEGRGRGRGGRGRRERGAAPGRAVPEGAAEAPPVLADAPAAAGAPGQLGKQPEHAHVQDQVVPLEPGRLPPVPVQLLRPAAAVGGGLRGRGGGGGRGRGRAPQGGLGPGPASEHRTQEAPGSAPRDQEDGQDHPAPM